MAAGRSLFFPGRSNHAVRVSLEHPDQVQTKDPLLTTLDRFWTWLGSLLELTQVWGEEREGDLPPPPPPSIVMGSRPLLI